MKVNSTTTNKCVAQRLTEPATAWLWPGSGLAAANPLIIGQKKNYRVCVLFPGPVNLAMYAPPLVGDIEFSIETRLTVAITGQAREELPSTIWH